MRLSELIAQDDRYDLDLEIHDGDIVTDIVMLVRVARLTDTDDALVIGATEATGGIVQYGIVRSACLQVEQWMTAPPDEEL
jgi:hypothetical protein